MARAGRMRDLLGGCDDRDRCEPREIGPRAARTPQSNPELQIGSSPAPPRAAAYPVAWCGCWFSSRWSAGPGGPNRPSVARGPARLSLRASDHLRLSRKAADEDVTVFGEELTELHFETLTTALDEDMRRDYQQALDAYGRAKGWCGPRARRGRPVGDQHARGRAFRPGLPARPSGWRPPAGPTTSLLLNPSHGPARTDVMWAPPGGVEREIRSASWMHIGSRAARTRYPAGPARQPEGAVVHVRPGLRGYALGHYGAAVEAGWCRPTV